MDEVVQVLNITWNLTDFDLGEDEEAAGTYVGYNSSGVSTGTVSTARYVVKPRWAMQDSNYNVLGIANASAVRRVRCGASVPGA